jgi:hypothetical protein
MCFSALASFIASGVLVVVGVGCIYEALKRRKKYIWLALVPIVFAMQQLSEGFIWTSIHSGDFPTENFAALMFLFFALFFWVSWIPLAAYSLEMDRLKKRFFTGLTIFGTILGLYLFIPVLIGNVPGSLIQTNICGSSLCYLRNPPTFTPQLLNEALYAFVGFACLLSSNTIFKRFWLLVMFFGIVTRIMDYAAFISVWCFFAAASSIFLYWGLKFFKTETWHAKKDKH